jgi:1-acyl-sn-glycerol-3-phosphate acyltransferase
VKGATNVPLSGGFLLVANHASFLDPIFIAAKLPRAISFLARSGLFDPPGFGWLIRQCNAFPVKQGKGDVGAMKQSIAPAAGGRRCWLFPEGNRSPDGDVQEIAAGAALIVEACEVRWFDRQRGAFDAWPRHRSLPRMTPIRVNFGKPTVLHALDAREIVADRPGSRGAARGDRPRRTGRGQQRPPRAA